MCHKQKWHMILSHFANIYFRNLGYIVLLLHFTLLLLKFSQICCHLLASITCISGFPELPKSISSLVIRNLQFHRKQLSAFPKNYQNTSSTWELNLWPLNHLTFPKLTLMMSVISWQYVKFGSAVCGNSHKRASSHFAVDGILLTKTILLSLFMYV